MNKYVKIYGERNTGTNYLMKLIKLNFNVKVFRGIEPLYLFMWPYFFYFMFPPLYKKIPFGRWIIDNYFKLSLPKNLGWKHSMISSDVLKSIDNFSGMVFFVTITKNPYSWLLSLHNRPYHTQDKYDSFEEFLIKPWVTWSRDNYYKNFKNPIEMWNIKNKSYIDLSKKYNVKNIRYEDLLNDFNSLLSKLSDFFDIDKKFDSFKNVGKSTKGDKKDFDFYKNYYLNELWKDKLSDDSIDIINSILDESVLDFFGYKKIGK